jgi:hypothetical protein
MADPIKWNSKIVLAKIETAYATDPTPTGAANAMLLTDVVLQPMEGEDVSRNLEMAYLGAQEEFPTGLRAVLSGSFEMVGSGTAGTAPAWGPLLRMCAAAEVATVGTKIEYMPVSDGHESGAIYFMIGTWLHKILGGRGTAVFSVNAQGIPVCRVTITGLFVRPLDQARPTPVTTAFQRPQVATKANTPTFTIGGTPFVMRSFSFDLGNDVQPRLLVGVERIVIVDRNESMKMTVEAVPAATYDPYSVAEEGTRQAVALVHGTIAGKITRIDAGQAQQKRLMGFENGQKVLEWPLEFRPLPTSAGNDQWKVTLT